MQIYSSIFEPDFPLPNLTGHIKLEARAAKIGHFTVERQGVQLTEDNSYVMLSHQRKVYLRIKLTKKKLVT